MAELIHLFLSDTPGRLAAMRKAAGQGDAREVEEEAHRLKGASANMALEQVRSAAIALEQAARTNAVPEMLRELDRLDRAFERARTCLAQCLEKFHSS
jgi:HPt (histidine-containing phosphotransfer) domain-containing protein